MTAVYIAAPYAARDGLRPLADELAAIGMRCTSSWLFGETDVAAGVGTAPTESDESVRTDSWADLRAVGKSDAVVQFTGQAIEALRTPGACGPMLHTGGRHVEVGYALARSLPVIVVGSPENIFQRSLCTVVDDWHGAVLALVALERANDALRPVEAAS